jgi:hypothetical protein
MRCDIQVSKREREGSTRAATRDAERATKPTQKRRANTAKKLHSEEEEEATTNVSPSRCVLQLKRSNTCWAGVNEPLEAAALALARLGLRGAGEGVEERLQHVQSDHEGEGA